MKHLTKNVMLFFCTFSLLFLSLLTNGCTFHFKATDIEAEGHTNVTYELKSIGLLQDNPVDSGKDGIGRFVTF